MADKLAVYNQVLLALGKRELSSLREHRPERARIDTLWASGLRYCLAKGQWIFATRTVEATADAEVPAIGYAKAFRKPVDWVRTLAIATDARFAMPLNEYADEQDFWFADVEPLYLRYLSDSDEFGLNLALWTSSFERYVIAHFVADLYVPFQLQDGQTASPQALLALKREERERLREAESENAMNKPAAFPPPGRWLQARFGGRARSVSRWDGTTR